ncbi:hypothetical protein A9K97_gp271 [Tokyovirus A1]|uniref:hypothetical protein n=1 Tax=Tokyovirus A1 TaxID=1826170 RepID=UPI0007A9810D|nr:hypothetical protein A9K97_gp271 [Tokyovirus A1]BAU80080.1 conserved hypothetical protein [Tokyovirus A1]
MDSFTLEKLEALREHIDVIRLEYDLCEKKQERKRLLEELDRLTCELMVAEETIEQNVSLDIPRRREDFHQKDPRDKEQELQPVKQEWLGSLIKNEKEDVYRLMFVGDDYIRVERQRLSLDPVRWLSVDESRLSFSRETLWRPLTPSEIFFPRAQHKSTLEPPRVRMSPFWIGKTAKNNESSEISLGSDTCETKDGKLQPSWIGKLVRDKHQKLYRVMLRHSGVGAWKVCQIEYTSSGFPIEGIPWYIPDDSTGWSLACCEEGTIQHSWIGKLVRNRDKKLFVVLSARPNAWEICSVENPLEGISPKEEILYVPVDSTGWSLEEEPQTPQKKDKGKEKVY